MGIEIELGSLAEATDTGPALMDIKELLGTRLLIQGNSGSGKSHLLRRLLEQSAPHVQQIIIDPEGDFTTLSEEFGHVVIDANRSETELEAIAARVREHRVSCVLTLDQLEVDKQMIAAAIFLNALFDAPREQWYPALVAVDEAQLFAPAAAGEVSEEARRISLGAMTNLMCRGRKRGLCGIIATQRLAKLAKNVAAEASNFCMGRTFLDIDMERAGDLLGIDKRRCEMFRDLKQGSFVALGPALYRRPMKITIGTVVTRARGSTPNLTPPPAPTGDEARDMILAPVASSAPRIFRPKPVPEVSTTDLLAKVETVSPSDNKDNGVAIDPPTAESLDEIKTERERALRRIVFEATTDPGSAYRPEAAIYQDSLVHFRISKAPGKAPTLDEFRGYLMIAKAGVDPDTAETPEWEKVREIAASIGEDLRVVYMTLARAALKGERCPSDPEIARTFGARSGGRARSRVEALEKATFIIVRKDMKGARVVRLPDLEIETAPGDPNAPDMALAG